MKKLNMIAAVFAFICAAVVGVANFVAGDFAKALPDVVMLACMATLCLATALEK